MATLIDALLRPGAYPHPVDHVRLIETHISWVLLAGEFAYKIKKPVDLGFLDFSTLAKRRFCCEEEIRLNRRLEPEIYLDVVPIAGSEQAPTVGGNGPVLDWAVRMRAFPADATLDRAAAIDPSQINAIAERIAQFHHEVDSAPPDSIYGSPEAVMYPVRENTVQIRELLSERLPEALPRVERLGQWGEAEGSRLHDHFGRRKAGGFVRECHGDLHLGNIAWVGQASESGETHAGTAGTSPGRPLIFDCIEFNPRLRFIDVISEVAFLCMDLTARGHADLAWRFLNRWLQQSGDYAGLAAWRFYQVYRAMVRLKVAAFRCAQGDDRQLDEVRHYLDLSERLSQPASPRLILMHGCSGSGKTWLSQRLVETLGAVRLRSDVERKRLFGLGALDASTKVQADIYSQSANRQTLERLLQLANGLLEDGNNVIVDATFLTRTWRQPFLDLARVRALPIQIVSMVADTELLRHRVGERQARGDDASEAGPDVLEGQLRSAIPLADDELAYVLRFDAAEEDAWTNLLTSLVGR